MGGSQGASGINQALIKALPFLKGVPLQVIHLSGPRDERLVADNYRRENVPAYVGAFHHQMEEVYSAADLVVARAGAASLA
jgi:UDP-N-acetylglucosamine--N-acetylmuramyl-(pentapeptide) pyrophosphoryl-undecaprenol N-acetylglucosamine transferase